jgi:hypothetical protein
MRAKAFYCVYNCFPPTAFIIDRSSLVLMELIIKFSEVLAPEASSNFITLENVSSILIFI